MTRDEMRQYLSRIPAQPFRIYVSDGRVYDVRYKMNILAETFMKIGIPDESGPKPFCHHTEYVRLDQIERVEILPATAPQPA